MKLRFPRFTLSSTMVAFLLVTICIIIAGGVLFCIINWGEGSSLSERGWMFTWQVYTSPLTTQTIHELVFFVITFLMGVIGLLLIYDASSKPREPQVAAVIALTGVVILLFSLIAIWWLAVHIYG